MQARRSKEAHEELIALQREHWEEVQQSRYWKGPER